MVFRYDMTGRWFKGNTHIHSTHSDGGKEFRQLAQMYADAGYDFLFRTDHWTCSDVRADTDRYPLLWLDGVELDGQDHGGSVFHVVCLGRVQGITSEMGLVAAMEAARNQGALLVLAHPHWMGNTLEDALRYGFHGVETYNHVTGWLNGKSDNGVYWSAMANRSPATLAISADDAHISEKHPGWNGGWIVVRAPDATEKNLLAAIRAGNFYASSGPEIHSIESDGARVTVHCSPVAFARLVGPAWNGHRQGSFGGELLTEVTFDLPLRWPYAYIDLEDAAGRRARTNALWVQ